MYLDRTDLVARFGTDEIQDLDADGTRTTAVIADACAEIDEALAETYMLPLPPGSWPPLVAVGADIARARLYDDGAPERVLGRLSSARKRLRELGAGDRRLVNAAGVEAPRHAAALAARAGPDPAMTPDALEGL